MNEDDDPEMIHRRLVLEEMLAAGIVRPVYCPSCGMEMLVDSASADEWEENYYECLNCRIHGPGLDAKMLKGPI